MPQIFSKVIIITLMLIAFVGQAFANSVMSCEMSAGSAESQMNIDHSTMTHHDTMLPSEMAHSEMNHSSNGQTDNCCGLDGFCLENACKVTTDLSYIVNITGFYLLSSDVVAMSQSLQPNAMVSFLYRPPIFA